MSPSQARPYGTLPCPTEGKVDPSELRIDDQKLVAFKQLLALSPIAKHCYENQEEQKHRNFGVTREWMVNAKRKWEKEFDWRKHEARINSFPNFKTDVRDDDGNVFSMHFVALFSEKPDAIPIVLIHGWPGSFLDFLPILDILRNKYSPQDLPYHIIVPSVPGFTLSSPPPLTRDWGYEDSARIIHKLVISLGITSYIVQGGDIGAAIARTIGVAYTECRGVHLNFSFMILMEDASEEGLSEVEKQGLQRARRFGETGNAYGKMHGTRPSTIGHVLSASPLALLAWIGEKFLEWTDQDLPLDQVLADVTLYWFTECFPTSTYTYRVDYRIPQTKGYFHAQEHMFVDKPLGYSYFPKELAPMPKKWVEKTGKMVWFKVHGSGGHFAALEKPEELWEDVEEFASVAWK